MQYMKARALVHRKEVRTDGSVVEFDRFMKSKAPSSYTRADFKGFKKHLEERGNSPRTVGKKLGFLSTILNYAVQDEKLTANPATGS